MTAKAATREGSASAALLRGVPYFRDQDAAVLVALSDVAVRKTFAAGAMIFLQDEPVAGLYVVESGVVKISRLSAGGREHILHLIQAGDTFNDAAVFDGGPNPATATAQTDVVAWRIGRDDLHRIAQRYPTLAWAIAESIARRTRHLIGLVEDLALRSVRGRLAHLLLEQARAEQADVVPRSLTQEEMASRIGTVREMVSRVLHSMAAAGIIEFDRHRIVILDPDRLAEEAEV